MSESEVLYMDKGRVAIPKRVCARYGLRDGDTLLFHETQSGAMILTPVKTRPRKTLFQHLKNFSDAEIPVQYVHCKPRV